MNVGIFRQGMHGLLSGEHQMDGACRVDFDYGSIALDNFYNQVFE